MALNIEGVMSRRGMDDIVDSAIWPKSYALKTGEWSASTARCAWTVSVPMMNETSVPSELSNSEPKCFPISEAGTGIDLLQTTMTTHVKVKCPSF